MRRLVAFVVVSVVASVLGTVGVSAQQTGGLDEISSQDLACSSPDEEIVIAMRLVVSGCFGDGDFIIYVGNGRDEVEPWRLRQPVIIPEGRPGDLAGVRSTVGMVFDGSLGLLDVSTGTATYSNVPYSAGASSYYVAGSVAAGRSAQGRERFAVPVLASNPDGPGSFAIQLVTAQETGPGGGGAPWATELVAVDAALPVPSEFEVDTAPLAVVGDLIYMGYPTEDGEVVLARIDVASETHEVLVTESAGSLIPSEFLVDQVTGRVFLAWRQSAFNDRPTIGRMTVVEPNGDTVEVSGLPPTLGSFAVVEQAEAEPVLLYSTPEGAVRVVTIDAEGAASTDEIANLATVTEQREGFWLSGEGAFLAVADATPSGGTLPPSHRVRVFRVDEFGSGNNPLSVSVIAPEIPLQSYLVGEFDSVRNGPVRPPGDDPLGPAFPAEDCLVDVTGSAPYPAVCFSPVGSIDGSSSLRESYIAALVATDRPSDEVLWIGQGDETPVKP